MPDTARKHVTIRYIQTLPMSFDPDEQAWGAVLTALPDTAVVRVHDVHQIGKDQIAQVSIVTEEAVSEDELAELYAAAADQHQTETGDEVSSAESSNVTPINKKPRRKRSGPPPTAG